MLFKQSRNRESRSYSSLNRSRRSDYSIADNEARNKSINVNKILRIFPPASLNSSGNELPISALCKFPRVSYDRYDKFVSRAGKFPNSKRCK